MKIKKIFILVLVVLCISISVKGTLSYFTSENIAHNVITTGNICVELEETQEVIPGIETKFPSKGISGAMPGDVISKIVRVKNTGSSSAWIRIDMKKIITVGETILPLKLSNGEDAIQIAILDGWIYGNDGYYYYNSKLLPDSSTLPLIREVKLNPLIDNEYQGCTVTVSITVYAVQSDNNGETIFEVQGWPNC